MHKIHEKEFDRGDFSYEHIPLGSDAYSDTWDFTTSDMFFPINVEDGIYWSSEDVLDITIQALNHYRNKFLETKDKKYWWQMIQLLPSSYNQTRNVMMNYEVLANIYNSRKNHKLDEWRELCLWIEELPYSELICGREDIKVLTNASPNIAREAVGLESINSKDIVEVTRCKNCQFYVSKEDMKKDELYKDYVSKLTTADGFCVSSGLFTNEDDFCSCAEI